MTLTLKPCPFCGGKAEIFHTPAIIAGEDTGYTPMCVNCGASLPEVPMPIIAERQWNTRYSVKDGEKP